MRAKERVCSFPGEVEFGEQAKFIIYEVVLNTVEVEIPFFLSSNQMSFGI